MCQVLLYLFTGVPCKHFVPLFARETGWHSSLGSSGLGLLWPALSFCLLSQSSGEHPCMMSHLYSWPRSFTRMESQSVGPFTICCMKAQCRKVPVFLSLIENYCIFCLHTDQHAGKPGFWLQTRIWLHTDFSQSVKALISLRRRCCRTVKLLRC